MLGSALRPPWPVRAHARHRCGDARRRGGAERLRASFAPTAQAGRWTGSSFARPGSPRSRSTGRLYPLGKGLGFAGGASVDSNDPKNLVAWLAGHATAAAQFKPWHAKGDVTLGADRIAVEHLRTEFERGTVEGSVVLRLARRRPAGAARWRAARGRARSRRRDRLRPVGAVGPGTWSGRARSRSPSKSAAPGLPASTPAIIAARLDAGRQRARDRAAVDRATWATRASSPPDESRPQSPPGGSITVDLDCPRPRRHHRARREVRAGAWPNRCAGSRPARGPRRCAPRQPGGHRRRGRASGKIGLTGQLGAIRVNISASATGKREAFIADRSRRADRRRSSYRRPVGGR